MAHKIAHKEFRILVVDDQPLVLAGLTQIINGQKDLVCCGEARNMAAAREAFHECKPDLVTIDLGLPDGSGVELVGEFATEKPSIPILVISQCDESIYAGRALKAGAKGYVTKECGANEIVTAMHSLLEPFKKFCVHAEQGFLGFGEALAKEQVPSNPVTEPKRSQNPKRPLPTSPEPHGYSIS